MPSDVTCIRTFSFRKKRCPNEASEAYTEMSQMQITLLLFLYFHSILFFKRTTPPAKAVRIIKKIFVL